MKQITEDHVSFEIAKLLKEKGFINDFCRKYYNYGTENWHSPLLDEISNFPCNHNFYDGKCSAPTMQMALKWLREVHKIEISIFFGFPFIDGQQVFKYYWCPVKVTEKGLEYPMDDPNAAEFVEEMADSYEQAVEAALLYVLKNLI